MPLFGSKKKKDTKEKGSDIEAPEEDGLLMASASDAAPSEEEAAPSLEEATSDLDPGNQAEDEAPELSALDGGSEETPEPAPAPAAAEDTSNVDDLLSAFEDDDSGGELAELTKDLEDVPIADLIEDLRQIRTTLPPDVLESGEDVA